MRIIDLIAKKQSGLSGAKIPTIAFLGDSVTQGCFEIYRTGPDSIDTVFDPEHAYHRYLSRILGILYPRVPVTVINAGISGDNVLKGLARLERDVLCYKPDLTVVSFGLNDSIGMGKDRIDLYTDTLREIFRQLQDAGSEVIYMTENMMLTKVSCHIQDEVSRRIAQQFMPYQLDGTLAEFFTQGKRVAEECGVRVCDAHAKWQQMARCGVDTTELLSNKINHPTKELNWLFAYELLNTMMQP